MQMQTVEFSQWNSKQFWHAIESAMEDELTIFSGEIRQSKNR